MSRAHRDDERRTTQSRERQISSWVRQTMVRHRCRDQSCDASKCPHRSNQNHVLACKLRDQTPGIIGAMHTLAGEQPDHDDRPLNIRCRLRQRRRLLQQGDPQISKTPTLVQAISQVPGGIPRSSVLGGSMRQQNDGHFFGVDSARMRRGHSLISDYIDQRGLKPEGRQHSDGTRAIIMLRFINEPRQSNAREISVGEKEWIHNNVTRREHPDRVIHAGCALDESCRDFRRDTLDGEAPGQRHDAGIVGICVTLAMRGEQQPKRAAA